MSQFLHTLFEFKRPDSRGQRFFFRLFEIFVVAYVVKFCWEWGVYIQQIDSVLLPLGIANYVDVSFMFDGGISLVNAALVTVFCSIGLLRKWRYAYAAALLLFHLQYVSRYCLGEISHGSNFIGMSLLVLAAGGLFFATPLLRRRFVLGGVYFFLGLGYTSAALSKIVGTGLSWPHGQHLRLWIAERQVDTLSKFGVAELNWIQELIMEYPAVGTAVLTFGLLAELVGFMIWWPRFRPYVLLALIGMHVGVALTMNILFDVFIFQLIILIAPWAAWVDKLEARNIRLSGLRLGSVSE